MGTSKEPPLAGLNEFNKLNINYHLTVKDFHFC